MSVFLISLPIFLIIFSGWLLKKYKIVSDEWVHILNQFAYYVSLPALIINSFWEINFLARESLNLIFLNLSIIILLSLTIFVFLSFLKINKNLKTTIFLSATVGNTIYMGFPLVEMGFGKEYLPAAAIVGTIYLIVPLLITIFLIKHWHCRENCLSEELGGFFKNPLIISVFIGVALSFLKILSMDNFLIFAVKKSISMLGATASPIALFTLGAFLYGRFLKKDLGLVFLVSLLKIAILPLFIIAGSLILFRTDSLKIIVLLSSMPVAATTFVIAEKFNLNKELVGNSILVSTIVSFIAAPLIIFLFS